METIYLEEPAILGDDYGMLKKNIYLNSSEMVIEKSLIQGPLVITYLTDEEKDGILNIMPQDFHYTLEKDEMDIFGNKIIKEEEKEITITFDKKEITAPVYEKDNSEPIGAKTITITPQTAELAQRIMDFKHAVYDIKCQINPDRYYDKYDASLNVRKYLAWLIEKGDAVICDTPYNSRENLKKLKNNEDRLSFAYEYKGKKHSFYATDMDSWSYHEKTSEEIENEFKEHVENLKASNDYYVPGTDIPKYIAKNKEKIFYEKNGKCYLIDRSKAYLETEGQMVYNSIVITEDSLIFNTGEKRKYKEVLYEHTDRYTDSELEIMIADMGADIVFFRGRKYLSKKEPKVKQFNKIDGEKASSIFISGKTVGYTDGNTVNLFDSKGERERFSLDEEIRTVDIKNEYVVINDNILCYRFKEFGEEAFVKKVANLDVFEKAKACYSCDFIENENGCFCIAGLTEEQKLELYSEHKFEDYYQKLSDTINKRKEEEIKAKQKELDERKELAEYVDSAGALLVPVYFSNPNNTNEMDGGKIFDAYDKKTIHGRYYEDDKHVHALYGIQEKGWPGSAYKGFLINVKLAKKFARNGKLHLDVPEEAMAKIIGTKGANINEVTEGLKTKGVDVSKIILHPKSRDEMTTSLEKIKNAIEKNKGIENGD